MKMSRFFTGLLFLMLPAGGSLYAASGSSGNVTYSCVLTSRAVIGQIQNPGTTLSVSAEVCSNDSPGYSCTSGEGGGYADVYHSIYTSYPASVAGVCYFSWTNSNGTSGSANLSAN